MSLVELVISSLIVSVMLVAALSAVGASARGNRTFCQQCVGANLARQLMAEALQGRYREPEDTPAFGRESGEDAAARAAWDDVDDYHKWSASPPEAKDGTPLDHADGWTRQVVVEYVRMADPTRTTSSDEGLKRITVTAISPEGKPTVLQALRSEKSIYDQQPKTETTYVSWVGVELQIGSTDAARVASGTNLLNLLPANP